MTLILDALTHTHFNKPISDRTDRPDIHSSADLASRRLDSGRGLELCTLTAIAWSVNIGNVVASDVKGQLLGKKRLPANFKTSEQRPHILPRCSPLPS